MLKFLFSTLLLANAGLFAYQTYASLPANQGREPDRVTKQFNAGRLQLLPSSAAVPGNAGQVSETPAALSVPPSSLPPAATDSPQPTALPEPAMAPGAAAPTSPAIATAANIAGKGGCAEIGDFDADEAKRFDARLAPLALGDRIVQRSIPGGTRFMVFLASGSREGADRKAEELRQRGVKDFFVIRENAGMRWAISLGIFRTEESAKTHVEMLEKKGITDSRITPFSLPSKRVAYQLQTSDAKSRQALDRIAADFPEQQWRACETTSDKTIRTFAAGTTSMN